MNKSQKMKMAARKNRKKTFWGVVKNIILFPWRVIKAIWRLIVRICRAFWNWLKSINVVGMINLTLLVAIIVLFACLISNVVCCNKSLHVAKKNGNVVVTNDSYVSRKRTDNRKVVNRENTKTVLPVKVDSQSGITPKIKVVGVKKPIVDENLSKPASELPKQNLYGDVIVDMYPGAPVLSNGVNINGNLFVQNMRKYTLPCDAKISGHLYVRNVQKLVFCGPFEVRGNIYVTRQSSFGPIPRNAYVGGQLML